MFDGDTVDATLEADELMVVELPVILPAVDVCEIPVMLIELDDDPDDAAGD